MSLMILMMMMTMMMKKCNKFDRYPGLMFSIILVQLCTARLLFVHHTVAIKHAGFVSSFLNIFVTKLFHIFIFVCLWEFSRVRIIPEIKLPDFYD